ncbi:unnamed protein product [Prorocentrum cordatum]|uniref:Altered inheritance of mitochondria protein 24, mitochondrial n=1 Tax=Prorocentrum cordatum TaxID=2364126 RepID=A0ABN9WJ99_9DINO|nr:unnamed protein product [Polarella glacialis]
MPHARDRLYHVVGVWADQRDSKYRVVLDPDGQSCSVETTRPSGQQRSTKGLIRMDGKGYIVWGQSFFLDEDRTTFSGLFWEPVGRGRSFEWWRCEDAARSPSSLLSPSSSMHAEGLERILGVWTDQGDSKYGVVLDPGGVSCSVETTRPSGQKRSTKGLIRLDAEGHVIWGQRFFLLTTSSGVFWEPTGRGKGFEWWRCSDDARPSSKRVPSSPDCQEPAARRAAVANQDPSPERAIGFGQSRVHLWYLGRPG